MCFDGSNGSREADIAYVLWFQIPAHAEIAAIADAHKRDVVHRMGIAAAFMPS
jgi:hypothetical protein